MYQPRSGEIRRYNPGDVLAPAEGYLYLVDGEASGSLTPQRQIMLSPGALRGPIPADLPLQYRAETPVKAHYWTRDDFAQVMGMELDLAISALLSLSAQQRQLNALLPQGTAAPLTGQSTPSEAFAVSTEELSLGAKTQQGLFQLAFYGTSGISLDILSRFGRLYGPGEVLCHRGEEGQELFLILEGEVEVFSEQALLGTLRKGDIVGEMAVLEGHLRSATVTAKSEVQVLALSREHFQLIFQLHPSWTLQLLEGFQQRLADTWRLVG